jgi:hypothetical protein
MPKYRYLSFFVLVSLLLIAGLFLFKEQFVVSEKSVVSTQLNEGSMITYICQAERSAYDELTVHAKIDSSDSSFGPMVIGINGQRQGDGKYWLYSIDGAEATVGASVYLCKGGEQITWELK